MDVYVNSVTGYLFAQSWQIAVLALIVGLISYALKNKSAHVRYLLWVVVLVKCLVPPYLTIPLAVLPERSSAKSLPPPVLTEISVHHPTAVNTSKFPRTKEVPEKTKPRVLAFGTREVIVLVWLVGVFLFLMWVGNRAIRYTLWLHRRRRPLPSDLHREFWELFMVFKLKKPPRIWLTRDISQPFVWGLFRGSVYLPDTFTGLDSPQHHRAILAHELSHIARFDAAMNIMQVVAQAVYWFHPLVWWANRKTRQEREKCCDERAVVQLNTLPENYTSAIVEALAAERRSAHPIPSLAIVGSIKDIEERIRTMMQPGKKFYKRPSLLAATIILLTALLITPTALVLTAKAGIETTIDSNKSSKSIHQAAVDGDIKQVKALISGGADVNARDRGGCTALHCVARWRPGRMMLHKYGRDPEKMAEIRKEAKLPELIRLFIAEGIDIDIQDDKGNTALHYAAQEGNKDVVELLISSGADLDVKNREGLTPIELAMEQFHRDVCDLLAVKGAKVSTIHVAAGLGDLAKVKEFIDKGVPVDVTKNQHVGTALHVAAFAGQSEVVEFLIDKGADVNARSAERSTALHGVEGAKVAEILIANGADVNAKNIVGMTPLQHAVARGDRGVVKVLISHGADTEVKDRNEQTPLSFAMTYGQREMVLLLITRGADVNTKDKWGQTPLHYVARRGWKDAAEALIAKGADVNARTKTGYTPLHHATMMGHAEIVKLLINKGADPSAYANGESGQTIVDMALEGNQKGVVEVLAAKGIAPEIPTIHLAAFLGELDKLRSLVELGGNIKKKDKHSMTPLMYAASGGNLKIAQFLMTQGADINARAKDGMTPLHCAAEVGNKAIATLLLAKGADVNVDSAEGGTALHTAVISGQRDIVELLIANGADINAHNKVIGSPLHAAVFTVDKELVKLLISKGADINARGGKRLKGGTPLHATVSHPYGIDVAEPLLHNGANVNAKDNDGATALHLAARRDWRRDLVSLLLVYGADVNAKDNGGRTPLVLAKEKKRIQNVELLLKHVAKE